MNNTFGKETCGIKLKKPLLSTLINIPLLLEEEFFKNQRHNIDFLVKLAINTSNDSSRLDLLLHAANLCEKFHSYFHFEAAFMYLLYAKLLEDSGRIEEALDQYKFCIFQSHLCQLAHIGLINCYDILGMKEEKEKAISYAGSFRIDVNNTNPTPVSRPFASFADYVLFATNNTDYIHCALPKRSSFWQSFSKYEASLDEKLLQKTIEELKAAHESYHKQAAILYYNCSLVFQTTGNESLAKNALIKATNLDNKLLV